MTEKHADLRLIDRINYAICAAAKRTGLFHWKYDGSCLVTLLRLPWYCVIYSLAIFAALTDGHRSQ